MTDTCEEHNSESCKACNDGFVLSDNGTCDLVASGRDDDDSDVSTISTVSTVSTVSTEESSMGTRVGVTIGLMILGYLY